MRLIFNRLFSHPYLWVNFFIGVAFLAVVFYSVVFSPETGAHPIPCVYTSITGEPCVSCGMSRGFSHIVRGDLEAAAGTNIHSIPVFAFFVLQIVLRSLGSIAYLQRWLPLSVLISADAGISIFGFFLAFSPMYL